jgi:hypothetical protein
MKRGRYEQNRVAIKITTASTKNRRLRYGVARIPSAIPPISVKSEIAARAVRLAMLIEGRLLI